MRVNIGEVDIPDTPNDELVSGELVKGREYNVRGREHEVFGRFLGDYYLLLFENSGEGHLSLSYCSHVYQFRQPDGKIVRPTAKEVLRKVQF